MSISLCSAQSFCDIFEFRNYNRSLVLSVEKADTASAVVSEQGQLLLLSTNDLDRFRYLFQGQEYDADLELHFFPSRLYEYRVGRFMSPDPKSQYHSPYLFVNADPVNIIDRNGEEGVPLVLYGVDHSKYLGQDESLFDLRKQVPDAHYMPITDFVNGKVPNLDEWNGNVFIDTHISADGKSIVLEEAKYEDQLVTADKTFTKTMHVQGTRPFTSDIEPERFGEILRNFSEHYNVPVQNVTSSGCQGGEAMERVGFGYVRTRPSVAEHELHVAGLKKGRYGIIEGETVTKEDGRYLGREETWMSISHKRGEDAMYGYSEAAEPGQKPKFIQYLEDDGKGSAVSMPYADGNELEGILNGRIPGHMKGEWDFAAFEY